MREFRLLGCFALIVALPCLSQSTSNPIGQSGISPNIAVDCGDPLQASSPECSALQNQISGSSRTGVSISAGEGVPQLRSSYDIDRNQYPPGINPTYPSQIDKPRSRSLPQTEFEIE